MASASPVYYKGNILDGDEDLQVFVRVGGKLTSRALEDPKWQIFGLKEREPQSCAVSINAAVSPLQGQAKENSGF